MEAAILPTSSKATLTTLVVRGIPPSAKSPTQNVTIQGLLAAKIMFLFFRNDWSKVLFFEADDPVANCLFRLGGECRVGSRMQGCSFTVALSRWPRRTERPGAGKWWW